MSEFLSIERHARAIKHANNTHIHNSLVILYIYMSCVCRGCLNHAEFRPLAPPRSWRRDLPPQHHRSHPDGRAQCFIMRNVSPRDANKDVSSHAECAPRTHIHCAKSQAPWKPSALIHTYVLYIHRLLKLENDISLRARPPMMIMFSSLQPIIEPIHTQTQPRQRDTSKCL